VQSTGSPNLLYIYVYTPFSLCAYNNSW
jgi:hypothetical protein